MVLNNVIVRADFVGGEIVPLCFQESRNSPAYHIGRIIATKTRPQDGHTKYTCRLKNSDQNVTLILDISRYGANWSVDMDCDCIAEKCPPLPESVISGVVKSPPFPEAAIKYVEQTRVRRVDCADLTAIRGEREAK